MDNENHEEQELREHQQDATAPAAPAVGLPLYLTTRASDLFGPAGHFVPLDPTDAEQHGDLLIVPTEEQLAVR